MSIPTPIASSSYRYAFLVTALALVLSWPAAARAQTLTATLTYPGNGTTSADFSQPIQWTSVTGMQAYYLYVGTTLGAKDLVNTGETQKTSYVASNLPFGQTLYARIWTKVGGKWRYQDSTFSCLPAVVTSPANGAVGADLSQPIQWVAVPNAQSYYLYVGTSLGAKDLTNSGEIHTTSYQPVNLPTGQLLYARIWTKYGGSWWYHDSTFTAATSVGVATITYPVNGAQSANPEQPIQWTPITNAQAYYLYVGTTAGARDLINTGETQQTSYPAINLPAYQTLYARLWTKYGGVWRYTDSTFSFVAAPPTLTYPANGASGIDQLQPATWTSVANAQGYYLYIGSTPGAKDLLDSYQLAVTSVALPRLPAGPNLYARVFALVAGHWVYRDSTFTASPISAQFTYPLDGAIGVDGTQPFRWTPPANTQSRRLLVGTSPGIGNLFDSGEIAVDSVTVPGVPTTGTLYARALVKVGGVWRHTDIAFTCLPLVVPPAMTDPVNGNLFFDTMRPFVWSSSPLARGYRLTIGTAPGRSDLHDSGEISVTRRFVPSLPAGTLLYGRLQTRLNGTWQASDFTFRVQANTSSASNQIASALVATDAVRMMALTDDRPFTWTPLAEQITPRFTAVCTDFAAALLSVLTEMNIQLSARRLDVAFNPNGYEQHTLVEMLNADTNQWMLLDPTFDLTVQRTADGSWASAEDVSSATLNKGWTDVKYVLLGTLGDTYARSYYIDYPLLFVNVYHTGQIPTNGQGPSVLPYLTAMTMPVNSTYTVYAAACTGGQVSTVLTVNAVDRTMSCTGVNGLSAAFGANTVVTTAQTGSVTLYRIRRFVF